MDLTIDCEKDHQGRKSIHTSLCNTEPGIQIGSSASIHRKENAAIRAAMLQENALKVKESGFVKVNLPRRLSGEN